MWKVEKYTREDFEEAERLERLYIALVQPNDFLLSDSDNKYLSLLTEAYHIIVKGLSRNETLNLIANISEKWRGQVLQIYRDAQTLYGKFDESNPIIMRSIAIEKLKMIANDMEDEYKSHLKTGNEKSTVAATKASEVARRCWSEILKYYPIQEDVKEIPLPKNIELKIHPDYLDSEHEKTTQIAIPQSKTNDISQ